MKRKIVSEKEKRISLDQARSKLARLWFIGAGVIFLLLIVQSLLDKYGENVGDVWSWFIPTTVPTLSLMIGVISSSALQEQALTTVNRFFYQLSWWLSFAYLLILLGTFLIEPFSPKDSFDLLKVSNYWLTPIQGLIVAVLGVLFTSKSSKEQQKPRPPSTSSAQKKTEE